MQAELKKRLGKVKDRLLVHSGIRKSLVAQRKEFLSTLEQQQAEFLELQEVHDILQVSASAAYSDLRERLETLVTEGLRMVFSKDVRFEFEMSVKRGKMNASPILVEVDPTGAERRMDITEARGCGVADVVAFVLRVVFLVLHGRTSNVLVADEPFRFVSREYLPAVVDMLVWLRDLVGVQFIIVTHKTEFVDCADRVFTVTQRNGLSCVEVGA